MKKKTLFIGWGDVVRFYYWECLSKYFYNGELSPVIAEVREKAKLVPGIFMEWGSQELDNQIRKDEFDKIFILTPPALHMSQLRYCLKLLSQSKIKGSIFIEKPIDSDVEKARDMILELKKISLTSHWNIRQIDHYSQKWTSRWLHSEHKSIIKMISPIKEILFVSYETDRMEDSMSYAQGYAIEHGTHAWTMINHCLPEIASPETKVDLIDTPLVWRYSGCPATCPRESAFMINYRIKLGKRHLNFNNNPINITIAAGKAFNTNCKKMLLIGRKGNLIIEYNNNKISLQAASGLPLKELAYKKRSLPKNTAYETIIDGIFKYKKIKDVTIKLEDGLIALERVTNAVNKFPQLQSYRPGVTPKELKLLLSRFPA